MRDPNFTYSANHPPQVAATTTILLTSTLTTYTSTATLSVAVATRTPCSAANRHSYSQVTTDIGNYNYDDGQNYASKDDCCLSCFARPNCYVFFYYPDIK